MHINRDDFGENFKWGVSAAAYQTEGAAFADGKGKSIWDVFTATKGKIRNNENAQVACDFYHHYAQDIALMAKMNIPNFRFSISWSRILPNGTEQINQRGIDFYKSVIDFCLEAGVEPWITLYHWDLPYELEKKGGWTNREIVDWFKEYVFVCVKHFGDKVKHWIILNEPMAFTGAGHFLGIHAPGRKGLNNFLAAVHHAALCQAEGARLVKWWLPDAIVGSTFSASYIQSQNSNSRLDNSAAIRLDALLNRLFIEPAAGLGYPVGKLKFLQRLEQFVKNGDEQKLACDLDFAGLQIYTREVVKHSPVTPFIFAKIVNAHKRACKVTAMNWEIYPPCIYEMLKQFSQYKSFGKIIVTENGAAFPDKIIHGEVNDEHRKQYLQEHISEVLRAKNDGVKVDGYFVWSFTDNFEWAEGYHPRFGLVHVDFDTQKRTVKSSGKWYSQMLKNDMSKKFTTPQSPYNSLLDY